MFQLDWTAEVAMTKFNQGYYVYQSTDKQLLLLALRHAMQLQQSSYKVLLFAQ